jgi:hypothetical protein
MTTPSAKQRRAQPEQRAAAKTKSPQTKLDKIAAALRAPKGATIAQLTALTGWQAHSVRGALSGALRKGRGLAITSSKSGAERIYKIAVVR